MTSQRILDKLLPGGYTITYVDDRTRVAILCPNGEEVAEYKKENDTWLINRDHPAAEFAANALYNEGAILNQPTKKETPKSRRARGFGHVPEVLNRLKNESTKPVTTIEIENECVICTGSYKTANTLWQMFGHDPRATFDTKGYKFRLIVPCDLVKPVTELFENG